MSAEEGDLEAETLRKKAIIVGEHFVCGSSIVWPSANEAQQAC